MTTETGISVCVSRRSPDRRVLVRWAGSDSDNENPSMISPESRDVKSTPPKVLALGELHQTQKEKRRTTNDISLWKFVSLVASCGDRDSRKSPWSLRCSSTCKSSLCGTTPGGGRRVIRFQKKMGVTVGGWVHNRVCMDSDPLV